jgi:cytosolic nonspecific dipeptidase
MAECTDPITRTLGEVGNASVVLLSMGKANSGMHSQNEKLDIINLINGTKLMAAYLYELSLL